LSTLVIFLLVVFVASVPVALPAAFTISLALGTEKLAKKSILVTKLSAVEETASMNLLCMDKTGTITENKIKINNIKGFGCSNNDVIKYASEASRKEDNDPIDNAILDQGILLGIESGRQEAFTPFDPSIKRTEATIIWGSTKYRVAKGAPKIIANLCNLDKRAANRFYALISEFSKKGYRTIAVATKKSRWELRGVVALSDRPRKDSKSLIKELRGLGIEVKMITGDNTAVAAEISNEVGLGNEIIELNNYDLSADSSLFTKVKSADGFAGVYPNDKYTIVKLLQNHGYRVGMTGDGVNDAPALKQAEVGIAVENATDIAKSSATLVLTKNGVGIIVEAIKESRRIFERMLTYTIVKIAKVIQIIFFIAIIFIAYGFVPITAFLLILLIFTNDLANISLSTDNVGYSETPDIWSTKKIFLSAAVLGVPLVIEALFLIPICFGIFHATIPEFETATFILFNISGKFTIFNARERRWFFRSLPSMPLVISSAASIIAGIVLAYYGILMAAISPGLIMSLVAISVLFFLISDLLKVKINNAHSIMSYSAAG
jgi:H+-transporting ATPase